MTPIEAYERASGNTVRDGAVLDSSGRFVCSAADVDFNEYTDADTERTASEIWRLSPSEAWDIYVGGQTLEDFLAGVDTDKPWRVYGTCRDYINGSPLCTDLDTDARNELCDHLYAYLTHED